MKIGIIGYGFVGKAVGWAYRNTDLIVRDPKLENSASLDRFVDRDAIFICVPSPSTANGHCDTSILERVLKELLFVTIQNPKVVLISKSTAPPSVYKRLQQEYPNLVHAPEFLTQANSITDYANASYCVLGGDHEWSIKARSVIFEGRKLSHDKHIIVNIETAALYKYMMNCYLATKVTFMNDFKKIADASGVEIKDLEYLASYDNRIGNTHMKVPGPDGKFGWSGACFPKDIASIINEAQDAGITLDLLKQVETINIAHRQ
jgi:nucleotide sugar dehydrogenase